MDWYALFPKIINMSLTASVMIAAVLLLRLMLKKAPKVFSYALWAVVLFRLLCPVSVSSAVSLLGLFQTPVTETGQVEYVPEDIVQTLSPAVKLPVIGDAVQETLLQAAERPSPDMLKTPVCVLTWVWIFGAAALMISGAIQYTLLRRRLVGSVPLLKNIRLADHIDSPFVLGILRPKIYLPSSLTKSEREYIILHEQHHIRRGDHVIKLLAYAALCVHWFNPLVWLAFCLAGRDMEMSCDEAVMKKMDRDVRAEYSESLLRLATGRRILAGTPLAFGEGDTKGRVRNVMSYKKPAFWVILLAVIACVTAAVCLVTNPREPENEPEEIFGRTFYVERMVYDAPQYSMVIALDETPAFALYDDGTFSAKMTGASDWVSCGTVEETELTEENFDQLCRNNGYDYGWVWQSPQNLRRENVRAWRVSEKNSPNPVFYYILEQENGEIYLSYGYEKEVPTIRWVFLLTEQRPASDGSIVHDSETMQQMAESDVTFRVVETGTDILDTAIRGAVLADRENMAGDVHCESHVILGVETISGTPLAGGTEHKEIMTVYAIVLQQSFGYSGGGFAGVGGYHLPMKFTFAVKHGQYSLELLEQWQPGDGADYEPDVRAHFGEYAEAAMDTPQYLTAQMQECFAQAVAYGNVDTDTVIETYLETVISSPAWSSRPGDYIDAHSDEFKLLIYYGEYTLRYCFGQFLQGGQTDLRGHIMAAACEEIMHSWGETVLYDHANPTGQDWFQACRANAENLAEMATMAELQEQYPASFLLLTMLSEEEE